MSFWSRLKERLGGASLDDAGADEVATEEAPAPVADARPTPLRTTRAGTEDAAAVGASTVADAIAAFASTIGEPGGPDADRIMEWVRMHRGTIAEGPLVRALAEAAPRAPEVVRVAAAELLAARGEEARALEVLEGVSSAAGLMMAADLLASRGQLPRAVTAVERVLAKQIDAPGARERHERWRAALGLGRAAAGRLDEATVVQPTGEDSPFRVLREVARGGAGTVYEAEDELLGRRVAFKVYHGRGADRASLEREVRAAVALAGPGVLRLFDASPPEGWMSLEWIARGSIRDVLRRGDAAILATPATWMIPLARALARLHRRGWVHGDVKPANVMLRAPHDPVLGDFGLSRAAGSAATGGSPGYVSPERLAGRPVEPRDDIYGFGRVVEDVLDAVGLARPPARAIAEVCMLPAERRPADGDALLLLLEGRPGAEQASHSSPRV